MQIELNRKEYLLVGLTSSNCLKLLPSSGYNQQQKVAVGDQDGVLQLFSFKKNIVQTHFKTLPGPAISTVQLAGAHGTPADKIFIATGNEIKGFNKKGKMFLNFNTNLTENITSMFVIGNDLFVCGSHIYNHYRDCKDMGSYLCGDKILDIVALSPDKASRITSILACEGRMLRVIEHSRVIHSVEVDTSPTVLHIYNNNTGNNVIYGTINGYVGVLQIGRTQIDNKWLLANKDQTCAIACLNSYDITGDGVSELLLARQDGTIEIHSFNIDDVVYEPNLIYTYACNENITSISGGILGNMGYNEIIISTYSGRIFGLTTELVDKNAGDSTTQGYSYSQEAQIKISKLKTEITELEQKLVKEREKYQLSTQAISDGVSAIPMLAIKDSLTLRKEDASYILTLDVQAAIDNVLLQCDVSVDLLDVEKNSSVVSYSTCDSKDGNSLLATYRCQVNTNRLEVKIRTIEGQGGTLLAYVTPLVQPKCCQVRKHYIKPLSLHTRIHNYDSSRAYNILTIKGTFSTAEMHLWISNCFPEVPEKPSIEDTPTLTFKSTFIDTTTHIKYKKGEAIFYTENISTMGIIKDFISKEATKKKIQLHISFELNHESIKETLNLIHPKLEDQVDLSKKTKLLRTLKELDIHDVEVVNNLTPYYQNILKNEKELEAKYLQQPKLLGRLYDIVIDLYVSQAKFLGTNVKTNLPQLSNLLKEYNLEKVIQFFQNNNDESDTIE